MNFHHLVLAIAQGKSKLSLPDSEIEIEIEIVRLQQVGNVLVPCRKKVKIVPIQEDPWKEKNKQDNLPIWML